MNHFDDVFSDPENRFWRDRRKCKYRHVDSLNILPGGSAKEDVYLLQEGDVGLLLYGIPAACLVQAGLFAAERHGRQEGA